MWWVGNTSRSKACLCSKLLVHAFKDEITLKVCEAAVFAVWRCCSSAQIQKESIRSLLSKLSCFFFFHLLMLWGLDLHCWRQLISEQGGSGRGGWCSRKRRTASCQFILTRGNFKHAFEKRPGFQLLTRPRVVGGAHTTSEGLEISAGAGLWSGNRFGRSTSLCKRTVWVSLNRCFSSM